MSNNELNIIHVCTFECDNFLMIRYSISDLVLGDKVTHTVYAVDAAGLKSEVMKSDGITVDTTPPASEHKFHFGYNQVQKW